MKIDTSQGWAEATIDNDCGFDKFYAVADILENSFNVTFTNKLNDFDAAYWDFDYCGCQLTLHYIVYLGVSVHPTKLKNASVEDNDAVLKLGPLLYAEVANIDWFDFDGEDKMTIGTEGGIVVTDIEHGAGARITLEKDCGNIPFAITLGIYSLMMHTQFESNYEDALAYVTETKFIINKIIEMYDIKSEDQDDYWQKKQDELINKLTGFTPNIATNDNELPKMGYLQSIKNVLKKLWG